MWRPAVNEQGGRGKNHEIGVSEFSSVRNARRFGGCMGDLLLMEAWARAASALVKCANSFIFDTVTRDLY